MPTEVYVKHTAQAVRNEHLRFIDLLCGREAQDSIITLEAITNRKHMQ